MKTDKGTTMLITQDQLPMVAIPSLNDTHLEEILIMNRLETAVKSNNIEAIPEILNALLEHTTMHFFDEEEMMEEALFPDLQVHKAEHDRHLRELKSLTEYFQKHQDPRAIAAYVEGNLVPWFIHHTQTMDSAMALFLKQGSTIS